MGGREEGRKEGRREGGRERGREGEERKEKAFLSQVKQFQIQDGYL